MLIPVLLAGGHGDRLWPASRQSRPKQFLSLAGGQNSLLVQTLARLQKVDDMGPVLATGGQAHRFVIAEQLQAAGFAGTILLEPVSRGTAPALAAAALEIQTRHGEDTQMLVLPTDHAVTDHKAFADTVVQARQTARQGQPVLFGVAPDRPETDYGYMRPGRALGQTTYAVAEFVEKPDAASAQRFVDSGHYYWNSGIFICRAGDYLRLLQTHAPELLQQVSRAYEQAVADTDFLRLEETAFSAVRPESIDYAIMEKTDQTVMTVLEAGWADLGYWSALGRAIGEDGQGNAVMGDAWLEKARNCVVHAESRLVAALGAQDQIIVETPDVVLVADRGHEDGIRDLVTHLSVAGRREAQEHRQCYRPWGSYMQIAAGPRFQVKLIRVKPGGRLSLQSHRYRAEHWVVVQGQAQVTCDEQVMTLGENQSTYIPVGSVHRLENPGSVELEVIEVQSGSYLGEDDIIRYEDIYGRMSDQSGLTGSTNN